jgi:outer membrane receptor protein involved in Fe transport
VHSESQAPQFEAVRAPFEDRRSPQFERTNGVHKIRTDSATGILSYQFSPALTSRTTLSYGDALVRRFSLPGLGRTRVNSNDFSAETVLQWEPRGPLRLLGGIHFSSVDQRQSIDIRGLGIGAGNFTDEQRSLGLFGEAAWRPVERLAIVAGVRCQSDRQDRQGQVGPVGPGITVDYDQRFEACLPKLSVSYDLAAGTTVGLLAQRAYNPGGTTVNLATRRQDNFDEERLSNYEAFARSSFAGGRGTVAANLFYNAIEDAQRPQLIEFIAPDGKPFTATEIDNAPSARSYGMEVELGWRASSRLSMRVGGAHLKTKILRTVAASDPILGKAFQRSPAFSGAAAIDWRPVDPLVLSAQLRSTSNYYSDDANTPSRRINGPTTLNARAAYTAGPATLFGYVKNALNAFYLTYLFTPTFGTAGDPREVGLGLEARF